MLDYINAVYICDVVVMALLVCNLYCCLIHDCGVDTLPCRQAALEAEKARAARVAALSPPAKDPISSVEPIKCT